MSDAAPAVSVPAVSVIVPAWGVAHLVGETLASLQAQTFADWEAIVVDDGAPDDVAGAVAPFVASDPRIRFLPTSHGGLPAARNRAIAVARAPLVALLDGDDLYRPTYLERMVAAISADPGLGLITCDAVFTGQASREGQRFSDIFSQHGEPVLDAVMARRFHIFIAVMLRRAAIEDAGGFDDEMPAAEDLDLWIRILEKGWRAGRIDEPLVVYRRRPGSLSASTLKLRKATLRVYEKAALRLAGRPEGRTAILMMERMRDEAGWVEGEDLIIAGQTRAGLRVLRRAHAGQRSARWRMMMALFHAMPPLARPLLAWRRRREAAEG
jgi:glycosyltransferase involved in cell wall biosynthesis